MLKPKYSPQSIIMATDALAPRLASLSLTIVLTMREKPFLVFQDSRGKISTAYTPSQFWEMIENADIFLYLLNIQHDKSWVHVK